MGTGQTIHVKKTCKVNGQTGNGQEQGDCEDDKVCQANGQCTGICQFRDGFISSESSYKLSEPIPEQECAKLVKEKKPDATGATASSVRGCYAEYGSSVVPSSTDKYCLFSSVSCVQVLSVDHSMGKKYDGQYFNFETS